MPSAIWPCQPRPSPSSASASTRTGSPGRATSTARRDQVTTSSPRSRPTACRASRWATTAATELSASLRGQPPGVAAAAPRPRRGGRAARPGSRARRRARRPRLNEATSRANASACSRSPAPMVASTARSSRCSRCSRSGLRLLPSTSAQAALAQAPTAASRRANASSSAASAGSGGVAASTRCRSSAPSSSTNSAAAACSRTRRSGPSCSYTAACTSGCGNPTSRIPKLLAHLQQPDHRGLVQRGDQVGHVGQGAGRGHRRGVAQHRDRLHQPPGRRAARLQPAQHLRGERPRRREATDPRCASAARAAR